jgi:2-polyprenyl-3-methyl-5-hydroxy-6-metoxy-1,4-benzoquinol methylase
MKTNDILVEINEKLNYLKNKIDNLSKDYDANFDLCKLLIEDPNFPDAVDQTLICDPSNENEKIERATSLIEVYVDELIEGKSFLDFGCGDGHVASVALNKNPKISIGYDINENAFNKDILQNNPNLLTTNWDQVAENQYDVILFYDVLDHVKDESMLSVLEKLKSVLAPEGKIYARMHPFVSRHSTHYYHTANKAFLHLIFNDEELEQIYGKKPDCHINKVFYPIRTYTDLFNKSKFTVASKNIIENEVEDFFKNNKIIADKIMKRFNASELPLVQMGMSFIDFVLKH